MKKSHLPFVAALVALVALHLGVAAWCWKAPSTAPTAALRR